MLDPAEAGDFAKIRNYTSERISAAARADQPVLIEAPPSSGKTMSALKLARDPDLPPVTYYAERTDLYQQAKEWAEEHDDITAMIIPSPHRDCPTFTGDIGDNEERIKQLYDKGESAYSLHMKPPEEAYTPCMSPVCGYIKKIQDIDDGVEDIDLLIGNHLHARREKYNRNRIVILDEYNMDSFLTSFPSEETSVVDEPSKIIPDFLFSAEDHGFPSKAGQDLTSIIERREDREVQLAVAEWFKNHGASRADAEEYDFISTSATQYDETHLQAPLLVLSLFFMQNVEAGYECAPGQSGEYHDIWRKAGLHPSIRCVRNRNSGRMHLLRPPDLSSAAQVIGLDGIPTVQLWNLLFDHERSFEHHRVIPRDAYPTFFQSALNMDIVQMGGGTHHYAKTPPSSFDKSRFATVRLRENERFALISTKNALGHYRTRGLLDNYTLQDEDPDDDSNKLYPEFRARHYGIIRSSNKFANESLGVVAGTPHPGDTVIQRWSALCGFAGASEGTSIDKEFGGPTQEIYNHFVHNQVVQAILRFGRSDHVRETDGSTVYVITKALPPWFEANESINIKRNSEEGAIISKVLQDNDDKEALKNTHTASTMTEKVSISRKHVKTTLDTLVEEGVLDVSRDHAKGGADLYRWTNEERIQEVCDMDSRLLLGDNHIYILPEE